MIASHSSARALTNHPRNMTDDMLRAVAKNGGVVQVNFYSAFIDENYRKAAEAQAKDRDAAVKANAEQLKAAGKARHLSRLRPHRARVGRQNSAASVELSDRSHRPYRQSRGHRSRRPGLGFRRRQRRDSRRHRLRRRPAKNHPGLLDRGYSADDIRKILGGNLLRVFGEAERVSREMQAGK